MEKIERVTANINNDKELSKAIKTAYSFNPNPAQAFIDDANRYIKAIKNGSMLCSIPHVSASGMSRDIKFLQMAKVKTRYNLMQFWTLFKALGYSEARASRDTFKISGCGMDMVFHTNYTNIHLFGRVGLLNKNQVTHLAQQTPTVV